ncbi:triphosphoribosyl-dephospho-CoA synthase CitG [Fusobacterium sp.]|uniref:triphosphoribosyl-dephospho-CoA synthase CitG n=1 Tax=Fusobacterium sp. TaxID=68766 RepID=UPI002629867F|nr:triphosphoribosyl-dephospho-CoA synthase CitG [Fusobacterium sp.]
MFDLNKFLDDREKRVQLQNSLLERYSLPLLTIRANYPGENKWESIPIEITEIVAKEMEILFKERLIKKEIIENLEGKIYLYFINLDPKSIKELTIQFEEKHILGRCVDLDVYTTEGTGISRSDFNLPKRKCLICDDLAFACGRSMKHSHSEIKDKINSKYIAYQNFLKRREVTINTIADLSLESMIYEVSSFPGFGLVTPLTQGAHKDMNLLTFLKSSFILKDGFKKMAEIMFSDLPLDIAFKRLREIGKETEKKMFQATDGVNTHKGMIFLLGIVVGATSRTLYQNKDFINIQTLVSQMTRDILKDFENIDTKKTLTHGEKLFLSHKFTGIRGEVKNGLDIIFSGALPVFNSALKESADINKASVHTLIYLMSKVMDSTIVYRHNLEVLEDVKKEMKAIFESGGVFNYSLDFLFELENRYIQKNISPGGSADLLAVTIFFHKILTYFY